MQAIAQRDVARLAPDVIAAMLALTKAGKSAGLEPALVELVLVRVSQINGCAFCLQFHLNIARKLDIDPRKFDLLASWRDAGIYSGREMAALGWAEALTQLTDPQARDAALDKARAEFDEKELVFLAATVASINAWNRIAVGLHFPPPAAEANRSPA